MVDKQGIENASLTDCNLQQIAFFIVLIHTRTRLMVSLAYSHQESNMHAK
jgi:hypothetical protein